MDERAHQDVAAAAAVRTELGPGYDAALAEGLVEKISSEIDKQVDARLAQRGVELALQPSQTPWANVAMGLGSVGLGIGATAVTLHALSTTATAPKAVVDLGVFKASLMTTTSSVSTAQIVLIVLIWAVIAVVNIAYARRRPVLRKLLRPPARADNGTWNCARATCSAIGASRARMRLCSAS